jgi:hypothetical protein
MDLSEIIRTLYVEKEKVENSIAALEALHATQGDERARRRGRKSMGDEERQQVSERMKKYWGSRRQQQTALEAVSSN